MGIWGYTWVYSGLYILYNGILGYTGVYKGIRG